MNIKNIIVLTFFSLSLYAMEIEKSSSKPLLKKRYGSLSATALRNIHEQENELCRPKGVLSYPDIMSLSLENMHEQLCMISDDCKRAAIRTVKTRLLQLVCAAICLPKDVVKNHICLFMLDGNKDAAEQCYQKTLQDHFTLYFDIKAQLPEGKLVGPLYAITEEKRDLILGIKSSWYSSSSIISHETKNELDDVDEDLKQLYLQGREIIVLPDDEHNLCAPKTLGKNLLIGIGAGLFIVGIFNGIGALIGLICCGSPSVCYPGLLWTSIGTSTVVPVMAVGCGGNAENGCCCNSQRMTL